MKMSIKQATTDHPVHALVANRFSPYAFADRDVTAEDLRSIFEAARWAPSSYNEQPWAYIVATRDGLADYERVLSCLVEPNQAWAKAAPVLALGIARTTFTRNDKSNAAALHDLGAASAHLSFEATARGLSVHQMIGIVPDRAREAFQIPDHSEALTGLAIGYASDPAQAPDPYRARDEAPRERKALDTFVFSGNYGNANVFS
jgi:nitroreductase